MEGDARRGGLVLERVEEACERDRERESGKREKENGDTWVFVNAVLSSVAFFGVAAPGWGGCDGGPGPGGGFCCHLVPGAWLVKTLGLGVCAVCCGLILGAESWRASFLSVLAASWVFLLSILAFVFSIICSWAFTWGGERWEAEEEREADTVSSLLCALLSAVL